MALGRQGERQADLMLSWAELPRSPGHAFYDRLQGVLIAAGFDGFAEGQCAPYYAGERGRPSLPPGRYFRMHLGGYCEGIDSERGLEWRCADSLSLREFLRLRTTEPVPGPSWLSKNRPRPAPPGDPGAAAARGAPGRLRLGAAAPGRARPDQGEPHRRRRLDHGGERGAARDRAARHRRGLPRDAGAPRGGERDRDADRRGPGPARPQAERQAAVERGVGLAD